jgi:hypothetical protein
VVSEKEEVACYPMLHLQAAAQTVEKSALTFTKDKQRCQRFKGKPAGFNDDVFNATGEILMNQSSDKRSNAESRREFRSFFVIFCVVGANFLGERIFGKYNEGLTSVSRYSPSFRVIFCEGAVDFSRRRCIASRNEAPESSESDGSASESSEESRDRERAGIGEFFTVLRAS